MLPLPLPRHHFPIDRQPPPFSQVGVSRGGLTRLLDFLGGSFRGGTDVTGALAYCLDQLASDQVRRPGVNLQSHYTESRTKHPPTPPCHSPYRPPYSSLTRGASEQMAAADVLLVPRPPAGGVQ